MSLMKRWTGSAWAGISPKRWNGSNWVNANAYKWDGSKWVNMSSQRYTKTWEATWSRSYLGNNNKRTDYRGQMLCQGKFENQSNPGLQKALCGFNIADIRANLDGAKIEKVELYLKNDHWYYFSGGSAIIGYHNHTNEPTTFSHSKYAVEHPKFQRYQARWIEMEKEFGEGIRDNRYKGISLFANSQDDGYYGVFHGAKTSYKPKIKVTYTK